MAADMAPVLEPGRGQLDLGVLVSPALVGAGLRLDHRISPWLSAFVLGEAGYSPALRKWDALLIGGGRIKW